MESDRSMGQYYLEEGTAAAAGREEAEIAAEEAHERAALGIWRTQQGHLIHVSCMSDSHLTNALAMLRRKGCIGPSTLAAYLHGPRPLGEMAQEAFDAELEEVSGRPVSPFVDLFEAEIRRRGLAEAAK